MNYYEKLPSYNKLWFVTDQDVLDVLEESLNFVESPPTPDDMNQVKAQLQNDLPTKALRQCRNEALRSYDWRTLRHASGGAQLSFEWTSFLQELRDLPQTQTPTIDSQLLTLQNVTWPEEPDDSN